MQLTSWCGRKTRERTRTLMMELQTVTSSTKTYSQNPPANAGDTSSILVHSHRADAPESGSTAPEAHAPQSLCFTRADTTAMRSLRTTAGASTTQHSRQREESPSGKRDPGEPKTQTRKIIKTKTNTKQRTNKDERRRVTARPPGPGSSVSKRRET